MTATVGRSVRRSCATPLRQLEESLSAFNLVREITAKIASVPEEIREQDFSKVDLVLYGYTGTPHVGLYPIIKSIPDIKHKERISVDELYTAANKLLDDALQNLINCACGLPAVRKGGIA